MADLYKNKYRIASTRLPGWDYGWNAAYFVTICTKNRTHWFGRIVKTKDLNSQQMQLSEMGQIANRCWLEIPEHFPFVKLGNHVVMPNHVHGIIIIDKPDMDSVGAQNFAPLQNPYTITTPKNKFGPQSQNLASIVRGFKIGVTKNSRLINQNFAWQSRYHDHIIRNQRSFDNISQYIIDNPLKWKEDRFYTL
ncbi:transposase [Fulvivirga kasyanovii]|uniref:Transposase IS200-like domain-containing protein n=1 Tax=Fulvivirga kasyanovii TaxID=396812 RepID=A0ABW9RUE7_9BACT|nr:transposase [Fulvivirga kasyanovii]MTI26868.1 hypothetical protein [Fulvivirga kasyanovii]